MIRLSEIPIPLPRLCIQEEGDWVQRGRRVCLLKKIALAFTIVTAFALGPLFAGNRLPKGPGEKSVAENCQSCHGLNALLDKKRSRNEWKKVIDKMVEYGMEMSDKDKKTALDYLASHLGTVP